MNILIYLYTSDGTSMIVHKNAHKMVVVIVVLQKSVGEKVVALKISAVAARPHRALIGSFDLMCLLSRALRFAPVVILP